MGNVSKQIKKKIWKCSFKVYGYFTGLAQNILDRKFMCLQLLENINMCHKYSGVNNRFLGSVAQLKRNKYIYRFMHWAYLAQNIFFGENYKKKMLCYKQYVVQFYSNLGNFHHFSYNEITKRRTRFNKGTWDWIHNTEETVSCLAGSLVVKALRFFSLPGLEQGFLT